MNLTEIYYFSGTGNSLFVARELKQSLPEAKLIPIASLLNMEIITTDAETVCLVFPIHLTALPIPVKIFLKKLEAGSAKYIFAVATRIGTQHSAFYSISRLLKKKGKKLDAFFNINLPSNDPKFKYKPLTGEETKKLEIKAKEKLEFIKDIVINKKIYKEKDVDYNMRVPLVNLLSFLVPLLAKLPPNFYADEKCAGCGACARVCLSGKIKMVDGKPVWQKNITCFMCYACLNYCPNQATQIKNYTEKNLRYNHPYASEADIAAEKLISN